MAILRVSNQSQLNTALRNVDDGDTILLASGTYSSIDMSTSRRQDHSFNQKVTIASANPDRPAVVNKLMLSNVENVEFSDLTFDYVRGKSSNTPFFVQNSKDITFDYVTFDGHLQNGYGSGLGLRVKNTTDVTVSDSLFRNFQNGLNFSNNDDVMLTGNDIRGMSNDGFTFGGIDGMIISGNDFRNYKSPDPFAAHKDNIQFRVGSSEPPSKDIIIRDNVIVDSEVRQGIFFGNELYRHGNNSARYQNITIEDNYLQTAHVHGISVFYGNDIDIVDNTVLKNSGMNRDRDLYTPLLNVSKFSTDVLIDHNTVASVQTPQNGSWTVTDNFTSGRRYLHWDGVKDMIKNGGGGSRSAMSLSMAEPGAEDEADVFHFDGQDVDGPMQAVIRGLDFGSDDVLILNNFDAGLFEEADGLAIWSDGGSVALDSALDLRELSDSSPQVTGATRGADVVLSVTQDAGKADIVLNGLAEAWNAASQHYDLF